MAVTLNVNCDSEKEMAELRDKICYGLQGSPAFVNSEIAVCDLSNTSFTLIIGNNNVNDIEFDLCSMDLLRSMSE